MKSSIESEIVFERINRESRRGKEARLGTVRKKRGGGLVPQKKKGRLFGPVED